MGYSIPPAPSPLRPKFRSWGLCVQNVSVSGAFLTAEIYRSHCLSATIFNCRAIELQPPSSQNYGSFHPNQAVAVEALPHSLQRRRIQPSRRATASARKAGIDGELPFVIVGYLHM